MDVQMHLWHSNVNVAANNYECNDKAKVYLVTNIKKYNKYIEEFFGCPWATTFEVRQFGISLLLQLRALTSW